MASGNMKDIKRRIKSVQSTITADHQGDGAGRVLQDAPREGACARRKTVLQRPVPDDYTSGGCNARQRIGLYQTA